MKTWDVAPGCKGGRTGLGQVGVTPHPIPHSVFSGPGESWVDSSKDALQLLFAGKEPQVRAAGQGHPGHEGPWGTRWEQGVCPTACHAQDPERS